MPAILIVEEEKPRSSPVELTSRRRLISTFSAGDAGNRLKLLRRKCVAVLTDRKLPGMSG